jgi:galactofuranosylgalactofuranosylrhamnosyl-N-acetylglucosaminyl-diphospho-decaprenol beta-1,5/1,6-galactofuranosyltransferase
LTQIADSPPARGIDAGGVRPDLRIVQRTVLRVDQELDIRPLYVGGVTSLGTAGVEEQKTTGSVVIDPESNLDAVTGMGGFGKISESGATVFPERRLTFGTYFNAFPASYWRRWTSFDSVRLQVRVSGHGTLSVYRSTSKGHIQRAGSQVFGPTAGEVIEFELPLKPFIDGGWYWFDVEAAEDEATVEEAHWGFETDRLSAGSVAIGITTFNRPEFCVEQLINLGNHPAVLELLDAVYVVDQGTLKVADHPAYAEAESLLGAKLKVIEQGNLGGSGGFSRAMIEACAKGDADYVLLLDDDVVCEPEGILRAVAFADLAKKPTIVGGQMFSLYDRSVLHAFGETVAKYRWFWGAAPNTRHGHNFATKSLIATKWLHRRVDVDYNGWWMCLIPTSVIREIGVSLPMFIKWDDAEFGLRAGAAGYPTVTLPGVAVWHVPWHEKDDTIDWQAYFHRRNRIVAALLHSPYPRGGSLVRESFETQVKHLLSMQYSPALMGLMAIEDILEGPQRMHRDVLERLPELRELRKGFDDSRSEPDLDRYPSARRKKPPRKGRDSTAPVGLPGRVKTVAKGALRQLTPPQAYSREHPEAAVPHVDLRWWKLAQFDSALVSSADGTSVSWYKRHPDQFRELMQRSVTLHARLLREWPGLAEEYRQALPTLVSPESWQETFERSNDKDTGGS